MAKKEVKKEEPVKEELTEEAVEEQTNEVVSLDDELELSVSQATSLYRIKKADLDYLEDDLMKLLLYLDNVLNKVKEDAIGNKLVIKAEAEVALETEIDIVKKEEAKKETKKKGKKDDKAKTSK